MSEPMEAGPESAAVRKAKRHMRELLATDGPGSTGNRRPYERNIPRRAEVAKVSTSQVSAIVRYLSDTGVSYGIYKDGKQIMTFIDGRLQVVWP